MVLDSKTKRALRAKAHSLKPVVMIGDKGLTENVMGEVEAALVAHELIKVKIANGDRDARAKIIMDMCRDTKAHLVQGLGQVYTVYRENNN